LYSYKQTITHMIVRCLGVDLKASSAALWVVYIE
jgi:hypothetical protein